MKQLKKLLKKLLKNPTGVASELPIRELEELVKELKYEYYADSPLVPDHVYDAVEEVLKTRKPKSKALLVGTTEDKSAKVELPFYMGSMDKVKTQKQLDLFSKKFKGPYVLSDKEDGVSVGVIRTGKELLGYKRSSGSHGHDISRLLPKVKMGKVPDGYQIRGELIIEDQVFDKHFADDYNDPRGTVVGLTNPMRKDIPKGVKHITFVAYEIVHPRMSPTAQFAELKTLGFELPRPKSIKKLDEKSLADYLFKRKKKSVYAIDGIIVTQDRVNPPNEDGNPDYSVAFKAHDPDAVKRVKVLEVEWNQSRYGYLIPRINIEPTKLGDVTVSYATAHNAAYVRDNNIGVGSELDIIRSGDVIPYVLDVVKSNDKPDMPDCAYEWTVNDEGEEVHIYSTEKNDVQLIKELTHFVSTMGVEGIKAGTIKTLVEAGHSSPTDFLKLKPKHLKQLEGFGDKSIKQVMDAIAQIKQGGIVDFMVASQAFGRGFAHSKLQSAVVAVNDLSLIMNPDKPTRARIRAILEDTEGWKKSIDVYLNGLKPFKKFMKQMAKVGVKYTYEEPTELEVNEEGSMVGQHVCITGFRDTVMTDWIIQNGGTHGGLSGKTTLLIYKDGASNGKIEGFSGNKLTRTEFITQYKPNHK
ncbi:DNA ligase [Vibrio phage vB_VcorM_GR11A]|nr:DNA ligase [Vibrio phage vB_VcorM_GR11A]